MEQFKKYIVDELGIENKDDIRDHVWEALKASIGPWALAHLYVGEWRLLSYDNFEAYYGMDHPNFIAVISAPGWFDIVMYLTPRSN